ncbi:hypothetical protein BBBOND_0108200 [Babesia bigemina]|uniref:6-Cys domain-containing protein n=1 Tax=Babesia bigemina TaxID=5866 RepID=A0A061D350_BABBI|nr:hypothetical protein BBBOND_0108200 [Babesia bigemina]CDR94522.1 hypothetical protein BBBOND_0108200 [Babesia bigemina]|eukprot:XP_012766708.1 hypothetical protein BBBOND_0108200 [Babesia bigemina]
MAQILRAASVICAVWFNWIAFVDAFVCDFSRPYDLFRKNAIVTCDMDVSVLSSATVICPRIVNYTEYVWHQPIKSDEKGQIKTNVGGKDKFGSLPISDLLVTESLRALLWIESKEFHTDLHIELGDDDIYAITKNRLAFICGPKDLLLSDALLRHLDRLNGFRLIEEIPWTAATPLIQEMSKIGKGLGVFFLNRRDTALPFQGCGSRPSPLFAPDNVVSEDEFTGTRSCVADPMSKSPIGFLCEGRIEPSDCFRSLLDENGKIVIAPLPHSYKHVYNRGKWVVARYFNDVALPRFNGECRCIDPGTGHVKARIEIRSKKEYVCDIASMIEQPDKSVVDGPRCSVLIHPGSTLTIRFPTEGLNPASTDEKLSSAPRSQLLSINEYETELLPKDLTTLRQQTYYHDPESYNEISYHDALADDVLELDRSQIAKGEIRLNYHTDRPLTLLGGHNSFFFHWTLKSRNKHVPDKISATINVSFALTHRYSTAGCDEGEPSVFDPKISYNHCSVKYMRNGIGSVYECLYNTNLDRIQVGIRCRPNEELLPNNCDNTAYDLYYDRIMQLPQYARNVTPTPIPGFRVFEIKSDTRSDVYACICADEHGYEKSRLVVERNKESFHHSNVREAATSGSLQPYVLLPWTETGLSSKETTSKLSLILHNITKETVVLALGTTLIIRCGVSPELRHLEYSGKITTTLLPNDPELFYYTVNNISSTPELALRTYEESFGTTSGGFTITYEEHSATYQELTIKSRRGAILISKDPIHKNYVPMTFVCAKRPEPSDLYIVIRDDHGSYTRTPYLLRPIEATKQYAPTQVQLFVETTDPYMQGCGVAYESDDLFKPETPLIYDSIGQDVGCKIDLPSAKEAAFYCPAPYVLDPPNCFYQVYVHGEEKDLSEISNSLVASHSNHFVTLKFKSKLVELGGKRRKTPPLECRCVTVKGVVLSTIQIENYYAK